MYNIILTDPITLICAYATEDGYGAIQLRYESAFTYKRGTWEKNEAEVLANKYQEWGWLTYIKEKGK